MTVLLSVIDRIDLIVMKLVKICTCSSVMDTFGKLVALSQAHYSGDMVARMVLYTQKNKQCIKYRAR